MFHTTMYKGYFIHGNHIFSYERFTVQTPQDGNSQYCPCKTLIGAKRLITKLIKQNHAIK